MHTGKKLGQAIAVAIQKKISKGTIQSKADVARYFDVKSPSIYTWIKGGTISKDKLPKLWDYFSDVVGPEHWGLSEYPKVNMQESVGMRIRDMRIERGLSQKQLADAVGIKQPTLWGLESGKANGTKSIAKFAVVLGVSALWLETGKGNKYTDTDESIAYEIFEIEKVKLNVAVGIDDFSIVEILKEDEPIFFRRSWLRKRGYQPEKLIAIKICDASMEPNFFTGDCVVINTEDKELVNNKVFAINYKGEVVVKRIIRDFGKWWMCSDNQDLHKYSREIFDESVNFIIGKIVYKQGETL